MIMRALGVYDLCRAATETSIAIANRLAETLAAHGPTEALDIDAAMQVGCLILACNDTKQCVRQPSEDGE